MRVRHDPVRQVRAVAVSDQDEPVGIRAFRLYDFLDPGHDVVEVHLVGVLAVARTRDLVPPVDGARAIVRREDEVALRRPHLPFERRRAQDRAGQARPADGPSMNVDDERRLDARRPLQRLDQIAGDLQPVAALPRRLLRLGQLEAADVRREVERRPRPGAVRGTDAQLHAAEQVLRRPRHPLPVRRDRGRRAVRGAPRELFPDVRTVDGEDLRERAPLDRDEDPPAVGRPDGRRVHEKTRVSCVGEPPSAGMVATLKNIGKVTLAGS